MLDMSMPKPPTRLTLELLWGKSMVNYKLVNVIQDIPTFHFWSVSQTSTNP